MSANDSRGVLPFVMSLLGLIFCFGLAMAPMIALCFSIVGLVLAVRRRRDGNDSLLTAAFVLGIIAVVISGIEMVAWVSCLSLALSAPDDVLGRFYRVWLD